MKLALFLLFLTSVIYANEMQRVESIIKDISNLRSSYEKCKKDLKDINPHAINSKISVIKNDKNICNNYILDIKNSNKKHLLLKEKIRELKNKIVENRNIIKKYKNLLKTKEKIIFNLENKGNGKIFIIKNRYLQLLKVKENEINNLKSRINSLKNTKKLIHTKTNQFPTLTMKKEYQRTVKPKAKNLQRDKVFVNSVASTYRLLKESSIYDSINGNIVENWERQTSFTSNKESLYWVKITGFFVKKKWKKVKRDLWIKKSDIIKRVRN